MNFLKNRNIFQKIIIAIVFVVVISFILATQVNAASSLEVIGGTLLSPIFNLLVGLGDTVMVFLQKCLFGIDESASLIKITENHTDIWVIAIGVIVGVLMVVVAIATVVATGGISAVGIISFVGTVATVTIKTIAGIALICYTVPVVTRVTADMLKSEFYLPMYEVTPYEIFSNKIPFFDVNFFDAHEMSPDNTSEENRQALEKNTAYQIRDVISSWYTRLTIIAIIGLLSVLIYMGIRILLSSAARDKAKYKQYFVDWLVAMCLLFSMHYIMTFSVAIVEKIIDAIDIVKTDENGTKQGEAVELFPIEEKNGRVENAYKILTEDKDENEESFFKGFFEGERTRYGFELANI